MCNIFPKTCCKIISNLEYQQVCEQNYRHRFLLSKMDEEITKPSMRKGSVPCTMCKASFRSNYYLVQHLRTHSGRKPYSCDICKMSFAQEGMLKQHKICHSGMKPFSCSICHKSFAYRHALQKHLNVHSKKELWYNTCKRHKPMEHKCIKAVTLTTCKICKKSISKKHYLEHLRRHKGERKFSCCICQKSYFDKIGLERHQLTHTGIKKFKCDECEKYFALEGNLKRHQNVVHR